jgi:hypothetical protein
MSSDAPHWNDVAEKLRRAMGFCPPTPTEADQAMSGAGEIPMSKEDIEDIVADITGGAPTDCGFHADHAWAQDLDTSAVADDMLVMNRNPGEQDDEVEKRIEELRREALEDDDDPDDQA